MGGSSTIPCLLIEPDIGDIELDDRHGIEGSDGLAQPPGKGEPQAQVGSVLRQPVNVLAVRPRPFSCSGRRRDRR